MSFPQTLPVDQVRRGQDYWRLETLLASSGDIYESDVSGRGFAVGPNSDVSKYNLTFRDPSQPDEIACQEISVTKPFNGRIDASLAENYASGQPARMLITIADIPRPPAYELSIDPGLSLNFIVNPRIDLVQYLQDVPAFTPRRSDFVLRTARFGSLTFGGAMVEWIPFYGRRYFRMTVLNTSSINTMNYTLVGLNFSDVQVSAGSVVGPWTQELPLVSATAIAPGAVETFELKEIAFDYIAYLITPSGGGLPVLEPMPRTIVCSDYVANL